MFVYYGYYVNSFFYGIFKVGSLFFFICERELFDESLIVIGFFKKKVVLILLLFFDCNVVVIIMKNGCFGNFFYLCVFDELYCVFIYCFVFDCYKNFFR